MFTSITKSFSALMVTAILLCSCEKGPEPSLKEKEMPTRASLLEKYGLSYIYDGLTIPEVVVTIPLSEWNSLLTAYDKDKYTKMYIKCDMQFTKGSETYSFPDSGLKLRGVGSRKRPEGSTGQMHQDGNSAWRGFNFQVNMHKYVKDKAHKLHGTKKIAFRYINLDPSFCRERTCFDTFHRAGVFTAQYGEHCRMYIQIEGDKRKTYFGIYNMEEVVDDTYVKARAADFGSDTGYLWKCRKGADLAVNSKLDKTGADLNDGKEYIYELKTCVEEFNNAKTQFVSFVSKLNLLDGQEFHDWIASVCDIRLLLRTQALIVGMGMWDDYWCNNNNYYLYFNSKDPSAYKLFLIPVDFDHTLGYCRESEWNKDQGTADPFNWGPSSRPLFYKILQYEDYRKIYEEELRSAFDESSHLLFYKTVINRIKAQQDRIRPYVANDVTSTTGFQDKVEGSNKSYKLFTDNANNFLKVRGESVIKYCDEYSISR